MYHPRTWSISSLAMVLLIGACAGEGTGPQIPSGADRQGWSGDQFGDEGTFACSPISSKTLGADEPSSLGFTAQQVLDRDARRHEVELRWVDGPTTNLTLDVSHRSGSIELLDNEWNGEGDGGPRTALAIDCPDTVQIPVLVDIHSLDGVLAEQIEAHLIAPALERVELRVQLDPIEGSLDLQRFAPADKNFAKLWVWMEAAFGSQGVSGQLDGFGERVQGQMASSEQWNIASFGVAK